MKKEEKTGEGRLLKDDLSNYSERAYKKPSVTVDIIICTIGEEYAVKVLLIKRKHPPFRNSWAIPGGFVDIDKEETLEQAAARELKEETGLTNIYIEQLKTYGDPKRDPRTRVITVAYFALIPAQKLKVVRAGDDAKEAKWFLLAELPSLAFDHRKILEDVKRRLKGKISYAPIAFEFVPEKFTWAQLQLVYEGVLETKIESNFNFRRKIKSQYHIQETGEFIKNRMGRPSALLEFKGPKDFLE